MLDDRLRQQLARAAEHGAEAARPPAPAAIRRRGRTRRWRRATVAAATACALTGGLVVAGTDRPPEPAGPARPIGTPPASFLAAVGGRVAVVSTASGKVVRYLTQAPKGHGQFFFALSEDRDMVWFSDVDVCGHSGIYRVSYRGGGAVRVDRSANAEALTVSQDGSKLVYRPLGCHGGSPAFAVLDLRTGKTRTWAYSQRGEVLGPMTWSPDGRHLAYTEYFGSGELRSRAWLLDTTGPGNSLAAGSPSAKHARPPISSSLSTDRAARCSRDPSRSTRTSPGSTSTPAAAICCTPPEPRPRRFRPGRPGAGTAPGPLRSAGAMPCRCGDWRVQAPHTATASPSGLLPTKW